MNFTNKIKRSIINKVEQLVDIPTVHVEIYHSGMYKTGDRLPNFYALDFKTATSYLEQKDNNIISQYYVKNGTRLIDIGNPDFINNLIYMLLEYNWFINFPVETTKLINALGITSEKELENFLFNSRRYKLQNCNNEISWQKTIPIANLKKVIQRNSLDKLDYEIIYLLEKLYKPFKIDGLIQYFYLPSRVACGMHHAEIIIFSPDTNVGFSRHYQAGGSKKYLNKQLDLCIKNSIELKINPQCKDDYAYSFMKKTIKEK